MVAISACGGGASTPPAFPAGVPAEARSATVIDAIDADTVRVELSDAKTSGVDIAVINVVRPVTGTCRATESDAFADQELPPGTKVYLVADTQDGGPDGGLLRYVWDSDGELYNDKVLRQGFATMGPVSPNQRFQGQLREAETEAKGAGRGVWSFPTTSTTLRTTTTAPRATTSRPTVAPTTAPRPTTPATTVPPTTVTVPSARTASLGETFSVVVGETVALPPTGLAVTYGDLLTDGRCRPGQQCIVAGGASISVTIAMVGMAPSTLVVGIGDDATTARYGQYTVELVQLTFGRPPVAGLRVT